MDQNMTNDGGYSSGVTKNSYDNALSSSNMSAGGSFPMPPLPQSYQSQNGLSQPSEPNNYVSENSVNKPTNSASTAHHDVSTTTNIKVPEESSEIEVEWVDKVDSVVYRTTGDPYNRSYQLALLKSEYIKKNYGKEMGQNETK